MTVRYERNRLAQFPWGAIAIALTIGVPAFIFATMFAALVFEYSVGNRILLFGDRSTGATADIAVAAALAVAFGSAGIVCILRLRTEVRVWRRREVTREDVDAARVSSLILAAGIVAVAMAGGTWLQDYRQFPWIVFMALVFPAHLIVLIAAGGPHEANGEPYLGVAIFIIATMMWYGLIEGARGWWPNRRKGVHSSNA